MMLQKVNSPFRPIPTSGQPITAQTLTHRSSYHFLGFLPLDVQKSEPPPHLVQITFRKGESP